MYILYLLCYMHVPYRLVHTHIRFIAIAVVNWWHFVKFTALLCRPMIETLPGPYKCLSSVTSYTRPCTAISIVWSGVLPSKSSSSVKVYTFSSSGSLQISSELLNVRCLSVSIMFTYASVTWVFDPVTWVYDPVTCLYDPTTTLCDSLTAEPVTCLSDLVTHSSVLQLLPEALSITLFGTSYSALDSRGVQRVTSIP